jgi:ribosomal protein S18 acetylase RimI-like enzyme
VGRLSNLPDGHDVGVETRRSSGDSTDTSAPQFRHVKRPEVHAALQLILGSGGRLAGEEQVVDFLRFTVYRGINLNDMWVAEIGGKIAWAVLPVISPGRTMLLFSPTHVPSELVASCVCPLIERVLGDYRDRRTIDLAQVLLDPAEERAIDAYLACGFEALAELIYLDRDVRRAPQVHLPNDFSWATYSPAAHSDFAAAVAGSYEASLDCPRLNGRRNIEDVLAGHKAAGEFDPRLWFVLHADTNGADPEPAGVLLLSRSTRTDALELVYLGLLPRYRGRGLGDLMMQHTLATAAQVGSRRLSLAVDSRNEPALRLYRRHGLTRVCTRSALIRDLR